MAMRPCQNCGKNDWKYIFNDETRVVKATCMKCLYVVEFMSKPRKPYDPKKIEAKAHYKHKKGKRFLKIGKKFEEVCIAINKKGHWRVMPISITVSKLETKYDWKLLHI